MGMKGIDVSKWNGNDIDFGKVKRSGYDFVIIRAGYGKGKKDPCFDRNYACAKLAGLKVGAYWYSYAETVNDAIIEAEYCAQILSGKQFELPIFYDVEEAKQFKKGKQFVENIIYAFCENLEKKKYYVGLYMSKSPLEYYVSHETRQRFDVWVAQYSNTCGYKDGAIIWQNSSKGKVDGIRGNVDTNIMYKDVSGVIVKKHFNGF